jgi:hypothetical protein
MLCCQKSNSINCPTSGSALHSHFSPDEKLDPDQNMQCSAVGKMSTNSCQYINFLQLKTGQTPALIWSI